MSAAGGGSANGAGDGGAEDPAAPVLFERRGRLGLITLNRPEAINAIAWRTDAREKVVAPSGSELIQLIAVAPHI